MDQIIDFSTCKRAHVTFGGTDRKFGVVYHGVTYMLKFSEEHAKRHDVSTSYVNNVVSEYISSHIAASAGFPVHETVLGTYNGEIVVGCKDFREKNSISNIEFAEYVRSKYDSKDVKRMIRLDQIYETLADPANDIPDSLQKESIERYWDTFVIDALVGNFDRHIGNWGFLAENNQLRLAPLYDFGSTLFPQASDIGAKDFMENLYEMFKRSLVFPSPSLIITNEKVGKVGYYDMLASNYDQNCTEAVLRIVPRIDMQRINMIIDETPFITDIRKSFYKEILSMRKMLILDRAYVRAFYKDYDIDALKRLTEGRQFTEKDLSVYLEQRNFACERFEENERVLDYAHSAEYAIDTVLRGTKPSINKKTLLDNQKILVESFGFNSLHVWNDIRAKMQHHEHEQER